MTALPLGRRLIEQGLISEPQLEVALQEQSRTGQLLGEILVGLGFTTEAAIASVVSSQAGMEFTDLADAQTLDVAPEVLALVPEAFAREHMVLPLAATADTLQVAICDTFDVDTIDELARRSHLDVHVVGCAKSVLIEALNRVYGGGESAGIRLEDSIREAGRDLLGEADGETPIVTLVDEVIAKGVSLGATDIHIEPQRRVVCIRYRVDGLLRLGDTIPKALQGAVESRVKIMADLDISERRMPQDGRIQVNTSGRDIDIRVSILPGVDGENMVLRLLDRSKVATSLDQLGFSATQTALFRAAVAKPHGIVLVTGPTGSGKTTTLYSGLMEVDALEKNVMTLEDPVEYRIPVIRQSQIHPKAGLTFATGLRALLRQDPDVILVGEMRDSETANLAMHAAMTGHLVLSTLHSNDAAGAMPRLMEMGVSPYLLPGTIIAVVAQRLARQPCRRCAEPYTPSAEVFATFDRQPEAGEFVRAVGCPECAGTGYKGRLPLSEILCMSPSVADLVMAGGSATAIQNAAIADGMIDMRTDGYDKARAGKVTLAEVARVAERRLMLHRHRPEPVPG